MSLKDWHHAGQFPFVVDGGFANRALPLGAAMVVYIAYLFTHPFPAYGAGLFLEIAEQIAANGYGLPARIPGYSPGGVPFAYPPLAFYVVALLVDGVGVDPIAVARFLPGLLVIAYLLPYYGIASELTASPRKAALATLLLGTAPPVLQWHLSAGGMVRAMAFLFALSSLYAGIRTFRTHAPRWAMIATVTFALVVLTHPTYTFFVVLSYLLLYAALDRSLRGLLAGAVIGLGGIALAAPWWLQVVSLHGFDVFFTAAGTHGGLKAGPYELLVQLTYPLDVISVQWPFYAVAYLGGFYALSKQRFLLLAWLLVAAFVGKNRFLFVPGAILAAAFVFDVVVPAVRARASTPSARRAVPAVVTGMVALAAVTAGTLYGAGAVSAIPGNGPTMPQFIDEDDRHAMEWIARNTPPAATFVVLGDAAEWTPFLANRTILIGPWGVEWENTTDYDVQIARFEAISTCWDAACLSRTLDRAGVRPDSVYVPKGRYTVRGRTYVQARSMSASLVTSNAFRVVFENEGVVIAVVVDDGTVMVDEGPGVVYARQSFPIGRRGESGREIEDTVTG